MSSAALCFSVALILFPLTGLFWIALIVTRSAVGEWSAIVPRRQLYSGLSAGRTARTGHSIYSFVFLGIILAATTLMGITADLIGTRRQSCAAGSSAFSHPPLFSLKYPQVVHPNPAPESSPRICPETSNRAAPLSCGNPVVNFRTHERSLR